MDVLGAILDVGKEMILCGAETRRVEDSLYRLCRCFGFTQADVWVIPSNIQATVHTMDGRYMTQIRHIRGAASLDFRKLELLNQLCRSVCSGDTDKDSIRSELKMIKAAPHPTVLIQYLAAVMAGTGFGAFFNCSAKDIVIAAFASLIVILVKQLVSKKISNPLSLNFIVSLSAEIFILFASHIRFADHPERITAGVVMLLISALSVANGLRDMFHLDTISGVLNITGAFTGAIGIAMGIVVSLLLFRTPEHIAGSTVIPDPLLGMLFCMIGCTGFALLLNVTGIKIAACALGAFSTWGVYLAGMGAIHAELPSVVIASAFCGIFSWSMAVFLKAPATIFQTICIYPLIPGAALYHFVRSAVLSDHGSALQNGKILVLNCFGIVIGFMIIEALLTLLRKPQNN